MRAQTIVDVVETPGDWQAARSAWNEVAARAWAPTVFSSWEWLSAWLEAFPDPARRLFVLLVRQGREVIGIAPWYLLERRSGLFTLREIGAIGGPEAGSDYLDVLARRGREAVVAAALLDFLFGAGVDRWDAAWLRDLPADSPWLEAVLAELDRRGKFYEVRPGAFCPRLGLPRSTEALRARLSANRRQQWARHSRLLARHGPVEHVALRPTEATVWDRFFALYAVARNGLHEPRLRELLDGYASRTASRDPVLLEFLSVAGRDVAAAVLLRDTKALRLYLLAVDRAFAPELSVGNVLVGLSLERAIRHAGGRTYDFLKGSERYKLHWARRGRRSLQLRFYRQGPRPILVGLARLGREAARLLLR